MKKQERERSLMSLKTLQNITKESNSSPEGVTVHIQNLVRVV